MRTGKILLSILVFGMMLPVARAEELPVPTLNNSVIVSIEHSVTDAAEVAYIKNNFLWGLYAWLSFSRTAVYPVLAWQSDWNNADTGIQAFKNEVNNLISAAETAGVRLHPVLVSGLARILWIYREAKIEDVRNAQWYNDNNIASDAQILDARVMDKYVFGTLSRYARKMRRNLEAKAKAALAFLKQRLDEKPQVLVTASGWGEVELNFGRIDQTKNLQDWFCDYSPFAVMEFHDWICHMGMYDDVSGAYKGQGYSAGGAKYQGTTGLAQFNVDFGTSFTTWDLKYYNWNLLDDWDEDPQDDVNNDPGRIPYSFYVQGGMMPNSGPHFIPGGFDPPRTMAPGNSFWDLWNLFRETMVQNFILDMARWSYAVGIPSARWYSHQIPADYLFGTNPSMPLKNPRYYTSASPLWTADVLPFASAGATIYDIKFPEWFARTTDYALSAISDMSSNWAILEYDAETYPQGLGVTQSSVDDILAQYLRVYGFNPHLINFWRWMDTSGEHRIKGMNKEAALREFVRRIRDKARRSVTTVFTPPKVADIAAVYVAETGKVRVETNGKIWPGETWLWQSWGDFLHFEIHRGTSSGFTVGAGSLIGTTSDYSFDDGTVIFGNIYYYRMRAVNSKGQAGPLSDEIMLMTTSGPVAVLSVDKTSLFFAAVQGGNSTAPQNVVISNTGDAGTVLSWTATKNAAWLSAVPSSGIGGGILSISVVSSGLGPGTYTGRVRVEAPAALNSPRNIEVRLQVYGAGATAGPFGVMDTPSDGARVFGSIPVTGWALDDIEVVRVEIKRAPHALDPPAAIGEDGLVYVGDGLFIAGARPDVEAAYPGYPLNYRAGWGFMVLTYGLPNQGNGTYTLYAFGHDREGNRVMLGQKTIYGDNAHSVLPFGTIDTPTQGGTASGTGYVNFGWALTPPPNMIPLDGSTLRVWVDGVGLGHPVYNNYRSDIATQYPGYLNSNGAVGYYYLDTTAYTNGLHTIAWGVVDNAGNTTGIGSRFFTVLNMGGDAAAGLPVEDNSRTGGGSFQRPGEYGSSGWPRTLDEVLTLPVRFGGLQVRRGYGEGEEGEAITADANSVFRVKIREVERVEIALGVELLPKNHGSTYAGFLVVGEELRALPIGSALDPETGLFTWQLGPGFLGEYRLIFVRTELSGLKERTTVAIEIIPKF